MNYKDIRRGEERREEEEKEEEEEASMNTVQDRTQSSPGMGFLFLTFRICLPTLVNLIMTTTSRQFLTFVCG